MLDLLLVLILMLFIFLSGILNKDFIKYGEIWIIKDMLFKFICIKLNYSFHYAIYFNLILIYFIYLIFINYFNLLKHLDNHL